MRFFTVLICCLCLVSPAAARDGMVQKIRYPVAAGTFYPRDPVELAKKTKDLIDAADRRLRLPASEIPKAIVVPHNLFYFSGDTAAAGYAALRRLKPFVKRVVLIGSSHQGKYFGISLSGARYWEMPDRRFEVDLELTQKLMKIQGIDFDDAAHEAESSLEVQLPFVSAVFNKDVKIVPVLVEDASTEQISDLMDAVWGGPETVVIVSTDMAAGKDAAKVAADVSDTAKLMEREEYSKIRKRHFCASLPVVGLLAYVRENGFSVQTIETATSADAALKTDKTVGFGAFGVYETDGGAQTDRVQMENVLQANQESLLRVAAHVQLMGGEVTLERTCDILRDVLSVMDRRVSIEDIQRKVAEHYNIRLSEMTSKRRERSVARPRQIAMYLAKTLTTKSLPDIGRAFDRDHTTVIHAVKTIEDMCFADAAFKSEIDSLRRVLSA